MKGSINLQLSQVSALEDIELERDLSGTSASRFVIADGTLQALKWLGLVLMIGDHINKYLFREQIPGIFQLARIVMPTFGFVLVYNLSRPRALERGVFRRVLGRLALFGALSVPICTMLNATVVTHYPWWPLNILLSLLLVTVIVYLIERGGYVRRMLAGILFLVVSPFVEYAWMGVLTCLGAWAFCRQPAYKGLLCWFLGVLSLTIINGNGWALLALPLLLFASRLHIAMPRSKWFFYAVYPTHLLIILTWTRVAH